MDYPPEAIFYVRLSLMNPKAGQEEKVSAIMDDLLAHFSTQPGFVRGYKLLSGDPDDRCGRLTVWKSENEADHAATSQHVLSARSELMLVVEQDSHVERSFTAHDPQIAKTFS